MSAAAVHQNTDDLSKPNHTEKPETVNQDQPQSPTKKQKEKTDLLGIVKIILDFKGWDSVFKVLFYGFVLWALYNLKKVYIFQTSEEWAQVPKYSLHNFKLFFVALAGFFAYKYVCHFLFYGILSKRLDLSKCVTEEEKKKKIEMACNWLGSMLYYITSSLSAFFLFRNQYFFPKSLGGTYENADMFYNFPYIREIPYAETFYMIQLASHFHTLIDYCLYKLKDAKALDMFLHHFMAVFLIFFSYLLNNVPVGIMVLYVHDPADIFVYLNRFVSSIKGTTMAFKGICYLGFVTSWLYFRLYAFPRYIVTATFDFTYSISNIEVLYSPVLFLTIMLSALVVLHFYWFMFIIRIMLVMIKGKSDYNVYDKSKSNKKVE